ncbi:hypothetical protein ES703_11582 [subsurface metagenome]
MRWLRKGKLRFLQGQRGIGLLETLIAVAILGAIGVSLLTALDTNARATRTLDEHVVATNLATAYIEAIKAMPYYTDVETYLNDDTITSITIPPQYIVDVAVTFSSSSTPEGDIIWVDTYTDETIQKLAVIVSREGGKPVLTICAFKTKRVVPES